LLVVFGKATTSENVEIGKKNGIKKSGDGPRDVLLPLREKNGYLCNRSRDFAMENGCVGYLKEGGSL
jgi:hypothetical protein